MKKFFTFMLMALFSAGMFADGTATTVYYTAPAATIGTYTVKLNVHMGCNDGDDWKQYDMVKTDNKYGEDPVYSVSFTDYWNGLCTMQFQLYDGSTWKSQKVVFDGSWKAASAYNGKMYVHSTGEWVAAGSQPGDEQPAPAVTLKGSFDSWGDGYAFTPAQDKKTASTTINIKAKTYAFKLIVGGDWLGEGGTVTRENCTDISFAANTGDVTLNADADGDYTFVYTYETKKLSVTFPPAPENPQPVINFYLIGTFNNWKLETCEPMQGDSIVYEFPAGKNEIKVLPQNTKWDNAKGFASVNAECSSEGITGNEGDNVIFTLEEKANVKVKVVEGKLCITGPFKVAEPQPVVNYYLVGTMNEWKLENKIPMVGDSLVANVDAGKYECKVIPKDLAEDWSNALGFAAVNAECSSQGVTEGENGNIVVELKEKADIKIKVVEGKLCITGPFYVPAAPTLTNGFYLIGQKGWDVAALSDALLFKANEGNENEYKLDVTLAKDETIKVVKVENDAIKTWYPDGEGNEYKVDEAHAGAKTIYFQETYKEDWKDFGGFIWIDANPGTGLINAADDVQAVKFIEAGQMYIRVNGSIFTIMGQVVR